MSEDIVDDKEAFLLERKRIRAAFDFFDRDGKGTIVKEEVGTIMRYLGAYPTEEQLTNSIIPSLQDDEESECVKYRAFESFMLKVIIERQYEPDSEETILQAFKVLDVDNKGYLTEAEAVAALTSNEWGFRDQELADFLRAAKDSDSGFIHYEDYASQMTL